VNIFRDSVPPDVVRRIAISLAIGLLVNLVVAFILAAMADPFNGSSHSIWGQIAYRSDATLSVDADHIAWIAEIYSGRGTATVA